MWNDRTKILIGENGINKLSQASVAVVGVGGVGGYVCMMLARAGVGQITLVDFDKVDETNINRQVVANIETVGRFKTDVMKDMILKINKNCVVTAICKRFCSDTRNETFANKFDFVVDAIDSVKDKTELICFCKQHDINIISAMGAGNRVDIPSFKVMDIYKTSNDGLAKIMRKKLRERNIKSLDVVISESPAIKVQNFSEKNDQNVIGSISYYPAMCGCVLGAFVINKLLQK